MAKGKPTKSKVAGKKPARKPDPNRLTNQILEFVDRHGRVLEKSGSPVSAHLRMRYEAGDLVAHFSVYASPMGNGSCRVKVTVRGGVVFRAHGCYTASAWGMTAKTYKAGAWEKRLKLTGRR